MTSIIIFLRSYRHNVEVSRPDEHFGRHEEFFSLRLDFVRCLFRLRASFGCTDVTPRRWSSTLPSHAFQFYESKLSFTRNLKIKDLLVMLNFSSSRHLGLVLFCFVVHKLFGKLPNTEKVKRALSGTTNTNTQLP